MDIISLRNENFKKFENADEAKKWGEEHYGEWVKQYNRANFALEQISDDIPCLSVYHTIPLYCDYNYKNYNTFILNYKEKNIIDTQYLSMTSSMVTSLASAPLIPENIVVYKLIPDCMIMDLKKAYKQQKDVPIKIERFFSTSLSPDVVKMHEHYSSYDTLIEILVRKNTFGAYLNGIETCHRYYEQEVLFFPSRLLLRLISNKFERKYGKKVYQCELLDMKCLFDCE